MGAHDCLAPGHQPASKHSELVAQQSAYQRLGSSQWEFRTVVTLSYLSFPHFSREGEQKFEVLLDDGKPLIVSQASSATSDRRLRVDVTATILK
jgi:hypothetical protein